MHSQLRHICAPTIKIDDGKHGKINFYCLRMKSHQNYFNFDGKSIRACYARVGPPHLCPANLHRYHRKPAIKLHRYNNLSQLSECECAGVQRYKMRYSFPITKAQWLLLPPSGSRWCCRSAQNPLCVYFIAPHNKWCYPLWYCFAEILIFLCQKFSKAFIGFTYHFTISREEAP